LRVAAFVGPGEIRRSIRVAKAEVFAIKVLSISTKKPMMQLLMESLVKAPVDTSSEDSMPAIIKFFQQVPFRPNYPTNVVFLLSVFQAAVSTLVNHKGRPFHGAILEHRQLLAGIGFSVLFSLAMLTEGFKSIIPLLELRPWPTTNAQLCLMGVFVIDFVASYLVEVMCKFGRGEPMQYAAGMMALMMTILPRMKLYYLQQSGKRNCWTRPKNGALVRIMTSAVGMIFLSSLAKTLEQQQTANPGLWRAWSEPRTKYTYRHPIFLLSF
jgi:hypothetical protein